MINGLTNLPSGDCNFKSMVEKAKKEELEEALSIMEANPSGNLTRILAIRRELVIREKMQEKEESTPQLSMFSSDDEKDSDGLSSEKISDNIVEFKVKEDVPEEVKEETVEIPEENITLDETGITDSSPVVSNEGNTQFTAADVFMKLTAEKEKFPDGDSSYVIDKLINMAVKDKNLTAAIMQPHKSYEKAFEYFFKRSREVGYTVGQCCYLDNDKAVDLAVEYFYFDEEKAEAERKAKAEELKKKREEEAAKKKKAKKPRKKKEKTEDITEVKEEKIESKAVELDVIVDKNENNNTESQDDTITSDKLMDLQTVSIDVSNTSKEEIQEVNCSIEKVEEFPKPIMVENSLISSDNGQLTFNFC